MAAGRREAVFRGRGTKSGEWAIGIYLPGGDGNFYIIDQSAESRQVDPTTAGAWTGLLDKDSCMIFEGDICELDKRKGLFVVRWDGFAARFALEKPTEGDKPERTDFDESNSWEVLVVGNIHDNADMVGPNGQTAMGLGMCKALGVEIGEVFHYNGSERVSGNYAVSARNGCLYRMFGGQEEQSPADGSALCEIINNMGGISRKKKAKRDSKGGGKG